MARAPLRMREAGFTIPAVLTNEIILFSLTPSREVEISIICLGAMRDFGLAFCPIQNHRDMTSHITRSTATY